MIVPTRKFGADTPSFVRFVAPGNHGCLESHARLPIKLSDYSAGLKQGWHRHEQPILTLLLAGHVREHVGSSDVIAGGGNYGAKVVHSDGKEDLCGDRNVEGG